MSSRETDFGRRSERLTRKQVATRLQISTSSVRRLEGTRLHPQEDERGVWWFDAEEVEALALTGAVRQRAPKRAQGNSAGDMAARAFRMFAEDCDLREIVVALRLPPEQVRRLYREWLVGLSQGERLRHERIEEQRERREQEMYERQQRSILRTFRS